MSEERKDFLSRWSQRKREVREQEAPSAPAPAPEFQPPVEETPGEPALTPEEIAALPKVDDLTADTDITAFLRKGVPDLLRNAALRRMWSLDPAIRDYVSEAREYAYDWNVPGGVPGNGPLLPSDNVEAMLKGIFGDGPADPPESGVIQAARGAMSQGEGVADPEAGEPAPEADDDAALQHEVGAEGSDDDGVSTESHALPAPPAAIPDAGRIAAVPLDPVATPDPAARLPRHGGARPV